MMQNVNMDKLVGENATLYPCNDLNCFQLGSVIFEVVEDEDDGYRSALQEVNIIKTDAQTTNPLDEIEIKSIGESNYEFISKTDGHKWLEFGTDYSDNYYPSFYFSWHAKPTPEEKFKEIIKLIKK